MLRDVAIGREKDPSHSSALSLAHYECLMDVLTTLHQECSGSLSRDKNASKFAQKCELNEILLSLHLFLPCSVDDTIKEVQKLRVNAEDFEKKCTIGKGHFGEVGEKLL